MRGKALVTGGNGFIGSHLVDHLLKNGHAVRALVRKTSELRWLSGRKIELMYGDLFDVDALRRAVTGVQFVYHLAGVTKAKTAEGYIRANTTGTVNLLEAVRANNTHLRRFVHISSQTASGPSPTRVPITEDAPPHPITTYGWSKLRSEEACARFFRNFPVTIIRLPAVFGPRDKDIYEFFRTMDNGLQPMVGFREKYISLVHVGDVVRGLVMAAGCPEAAGETYFLSSKESYGWREVGDVVRRVMEKNVLRIHVPEFGVYAIAAVGELIAKFSRKPALINFEKARDMVQDNWTCSSAKAKRDFGYEQEISLEEGIRDAVAWYRMEGWLKERPIEN